MTADRQNAAVPLLPLFELEKKTTHNLPLAKWWGLHILILNSRPRPMAAEDEQTWRSWEPVNGPFEFRIIFFYQRARGEQWVF